MFGPFADFISGIARNRREVLSGIYFSPWEMPFHFKKYEWNVIALFNSFTLK